jgi:hypothetical protein
MDFWTHPRVRRIKMTEVSEFFLLFDVGRIK